MVSSVSTINYPPRRVDLLEDTGWRCWVYKYINGKDQPVLKRFGSKILFYEHLVMVLQDSDVCHIQD